jgi:hypothetical protein
MNEYNKTTGEIKTPNWSSQLQYSQLLGKVMEACITAMFEAHNDPRHYDEWLRTLEALKTLAFVSPKALKKIDARFDRVREVMNCVLGGKTKVYTSELDLVNSPAKRYEVDEALRQAQETTFQELYAAGLVIPRKRQYAPDQSDIYSDE